MTPCSFCGQRGLKIYPLDIKYRTGDNQEGQYYAICDPCYRWFDKVIQFRVLDTERFLAHEERISRK